MNAVRSRNDLDLGGGRGRARRSATLIIRLGLAALIVPLRTGPVSAQDDRTPAMVAATPLRLVDPEGRPVAGAVVSTAFECDRDRSRAFLPRGFDEVQRSDARGEASLRLRIRGGADGVAIYAILQEPDRDRPLVGLLNVTREQVGKPVTITMHPACRVRVRAECPGFRELESMHNAELEGPSFWRAADVLLGEPPGAPWALTCVSTSGELEFLLPPGRYTLIVYGANATGELKPIEVLPGHRVRSFGIVELTPDDSVQQGDFREFHHWIPRNSDARARVRLRRVRGHSHKPAIFGGARAVAYSPDGEFLATAHWYKGVTGDAKLWNARTGDFVATLPAPVELAGVLNLAFSPDGKLLAGVVGEPVRSQPPPMVALWDVTARRTIRTFEADPAQVSALAFSPDSRTFVSGGSDQCVHFWDVATGRETRRIEQNPGPVKSLMFTSGAERLVIASGDTLRVWDLEGNRLHAKLEPAEFTFHSAALSPDGRTVALAGRSAQRSQVRLYDVAEDPPALRAELVFTGPDQAARPEWPYSAVAFTADGRSVVAVQLIRVVMWDVATGTMKDYFGKQTGSTEDRIAISPRGQWLAMTDAGLARTIDITPPTPP